LTSGGCERHAISLMNRLGERGHECHAVTVKDGDELTRDLRLAAGGTLKCLGAARYLDWRAVSDFAAHVARVGPDAIVAANPYALMYSTLARRRSGTPARLVVTYHSTRLPGIKEPLMMAGYLPFFWAADQAIFVSSGQARHCMRRGVLSRRNAVIHNGVDVSWYRDTGEAQAELRGRFGIAPGEFVIGLTAVLRPEKNPVQLVYAVSRLRAMGIPARALIIGDGEMRAAVEARARDLGVASHVSITGFQADVRPYIAACDAMVLCSTSVETFSLAALEAMAMGKPAVLSELGGAAEMIYPDWNGYLFPAGDSAALVERLARLADPGACARMGRNARRLVESSFSEATMVDRYERMLLGLCAPSPRPSGPWPAGHRVNNPGV
jgi:glycosyltransferase involved in cell wall biosynthesis